MKLNGRFLADLLDGSGSPSNRIRDRFSMAEAQRNECDAMLLFEIRYQFRRYNYVTGEKCSTTHQPELCFGLIFTRINSNMRWNQDINTCLSLTVIPAAA